MGFSLFRSIQFGVLLAVIYYAVVFNNGDSIRAETKVIKENIVKQKKILNTAIKKEKNLREFSKLFNNLALQAAGKMLSILNSTSEGVFFSVFLSDHAKQLDLYILSLGRTIVSTQDQWGVQEIHLSVEGGYHQLMQFVANIQNEEKLVIVEKVTLSVTTAGFGVRGVERLRANFTIKLYQFINKSKE